MNFLVDENMPRSLASKIAELGFSVQDVRNTDISLDHRVNVFNHNSNARTLVAIA